MLYLVRLTDIDERSSFQLYYSLPVFAILLFAGPPLTTRSPWQVALSPGRAVPEIDVIPLFSSILPSFFSSQSRNRSIITRSRGFEEKSRKLISRNDDQGHLKFFSRKTTIPFFFKEFFYLILPRNREINSHANIDRSDKYSSDCEVTNCKHTLVEDFPFLAVRFLIRFFERKTFRKKIKIKIKERKKTSTLLFAIRHRYLVIGTR